MIIVIVTNVVFLNYVIAEAGDSVVELSWNDMNMSGTDDFYFHNDAVDNGF